MPFARAEVTLFELNIIERRSSKEVLMVQSHEQGFLLEIASGLRDHFTILKLILLVNGVPFFLELT